VIIDAGIGAPSDAAKQWIGGLMLFWSSTAITVAANPQLMARSV